MLSPRPAPVLLIAGALVSRRRLQRQDRRARRLDGGSSGTIMPDAQGNLPYVAPTPAPPRSPRAPGG